MWGGVIIIWVACLSGVYPSIKLSSAALFSVAVAILTWTFRSLLAKISTLEEIISSKGREISHLKRMEEVAEARGNRMISLLQKKFQSEMIEDSTLCSGVGCFKNAEWGICSHGYYSRQISVLKVKTESGKEIVLTPEREDTIINHIKDVRNAIDVRVSYEVLESYEYDI